MRCGQTESAAKTNARSKTANRSRQGALNTLTLLRLCLGRNRQRSGSALCISASTERIAANGDVAAPADPIVFADGMCVCRGFAPRSGTQFRPVTRIINKIRKKSSPFRNQPFANGVFGYILLKLCSEISMIARNWIGLLAPEHADRQSMK